MPGRSGVGRECAASLRRAGMPGTAYVAVDGHQANVRDPHRLPDAGLRGSRSSASTTASRSSMLSYTKVIAEDPKRQGLLYVGTENAIYVSFNDGDDWQPLQNNLPHAPVSGIVIQEHFNDLVVGHLRPRLLDPRRPGADPADDRRRSWRPASHLFELRDAYRFRPITPPIGSLLRSDGGPGPGIRRLDQLLARRSPHRPRRPSRSSTAQGRGVATLRGTNRAGVNRIHWDLRRRAERTDSPAHVPDVRRAHRRG